MEFHRHVLELSFPVVTILLLVWFDALVKRTELKNKLEYTRQH